MPMTSPDMTILITMLFFVFVIGSIIGSFLNVVILRAFSGESIVLPPSKCPKCGKLLFIKKGKNYKYCADKACGYSEAPEKAKKE